jgi:hypothetical protein
MQQDGQQLRFATARLASGPRVHYGEQGDPGGEAIVFLPAYTDSWFSYSRVLPLLPRATTPSPWTSVATATPSGRPAVTALRTSPPTWWPSWMPSGSSVPAWSAIRGAALSPGEWQNSSLSASPGWC